MLQLLLTGYSADIQGACAQHTTKFSFTQFMVNDKSTPREFPLWIWLLRSNKKPSFQVMLIVWWRERIRTFESIYTETLQEQIASFIRPSVKGVGLQPLVCWNCSFKSLLGDGCLSCVFLLSGRGLCYCLITRPEKSYRVLCV